MPGFQGWELYTLVAGRILQVTNSEEHTCNLFFANWNQLLSICWHSPYFSHSQIKPVVSRSTPRFSLSLLSFCWLWGSEFLRSSTAVAVGRRGGIWSAVRCWHRSRWLISPLGSQAWPHLCLGLLGQVISPVHSSCVLLIQGLQTYSQSPSWSRTVRSSFGILRAGSSLSVSTCRDEHFYFIDTTLW